MKLLKTFEQQIQSMGELKRVWLTSFNLGIEFVEKYLLPTALAMDPPKSRLDYEQMQLALTDKQIDFRVFSDMRFMDLRQNKRTAIPVHGISPARHEHFSQESLFHPKVIYLEDVNGKMILGAGSANLTISGWGRNQEVFQFYEITAQAQYGAVREFFDELFKLAGLGACPLGQRRFVETNPSWRFVHSFQKRTFLEQLFDGSGAKHLLVWSPYLPSDLPAYIEKLKDVAGTTDLSVAVVTDWIGGQYIRTQWNDRLRQMLNDGVITFYENPFRPHPNVELCHSKIWKLPGRLAIGSWNFTSRGSNCRYEENGDWSQQNNIEAGMLIDAKFSWEEAVGNAIKVGSDDFASIELLEEESLKVDQELPFDLQVTFDWGKLRYEFSGEWHEGAPEDNYWLKVPGVNEAMKLSWAPRKRSLQVDGLDVPEQFDLLSEHCFEVIRDKGVVYRGLVTEQGLSFRRAKAFASLSDLLDALVFGSDLDSGGGAPFRFPVDDSGDTEEEKPKKSEPDVNDQPLVSISTEDISYFRLFKAMARYAKEINAVRSVKELNQWVFSLPGCLAELTAKVSARVDAAEPSVFNWFLAQEVNSLCKLANKKRRELGNDADSLPSYRWDRLDIPRLSLPDGIQPSYAELIEKECSYVRA